MEQNDNKNLISEILEKQNDNNIIKKLILTIFGIIIIVWFCLLYSLLPKRMDDTSSGAIKFNVAMELIVVLVAREPALIMVV
ncbi:hypothetical protein [Spiroplasma endosymbiont of Dromius quadrimaculatus]|uniref:hypothetical protein n=1 Tax=Spiroplasma endosymbiont of Dromius quadrimaculatus TaxID=3066283 RepID=UPI00313EA2F7